MKRLKVATGPSRELTRAELEIMQILWRKEAAFVAQIIEEMAEPKPAYNTVSTVIRVLEKKVSSPTKPTEKVTAITPCSTNVSTRNT